MGTIDQKSMLLSWKSEIDQQVDAKEKELNTLQFESAYCVMQINIYKNPELKEKFEAEIASLGKRIGELETEIQQVKHEYHNLVDLNDFIEGRLNRY